MASDAPAAARAEAFSSSRLEPAEILYQDRAHAGKVLASALAELHLPHPVVLAIPRGGIVVGEQVRRQLACPLYVLAAQKIAAPGYPELSMGAIAEGGVRVIDPVVQRLLGVRGEELRLCVDIARLEQRRRAARYRSHRPAGSLAGRTAVLVDDGIASGATMRAAVQALRQRHPAAVVVAAPLALSHTVEALRPLVDRVVVPQVQKASRHISRAYAAFDAVPEREVLRILSGVAAAVREPHGTCSAPSPPAAPAAGATAQIQVRGGVLGAEWTLPAKPWALVLFAHGSGSGRDSVRNRAIALAFQRAGMATLLIDLLTRDEVARSGTSLLARDLDLLAARLSDAGDWMRRQPACSGLPLVLVGSSAGAAAAVRAQRLHPGLAQALICRSGRLDLVPDEAGATGAPMLLVAGQEDGELVTIHRKAREKLASDGGHCVVTLPGVSHGFDEPGALSLFSSVARCWLRRLFRT